MTDKRMEGIGGVEAANSRAQADLGVESLHLSSGICTDRSRGGNRVQDQLEVIAHDLSDSLGRAASFSIGYRPDRGDRHHEAKAASMGHPVRLWRAIDALGGTSEGYDERSRGYAAGYRHALGDVLALLEERGFTEHSVPLDGFEPFDITKPKSLDGDAALAMDVLALYRHGGSFTSADANRVAQVIAQLRTAVRHEREHAGKCQARRQVAEGEREAMRATGHVLEDNLAQMTAALAKAEHDRNNAFALADAADGLLRRAEIAEAALADMTAERDAAAENARRHRNRADHLHETLLGVRDDLHNENGHNTLSVADTIWHGSAETTVDYIDAALVADTSKPRCRVVTSPRFYSHADQKRAADALNKHANDIGVGMRVIHRLELVETVAEALGMRKGA